ncbi:MAG: hypothetical protein ACRDNW_14875 [Trebonia sp.]
MSTFGTLPSRLCPVLAYLSCGYSQRVPRGVSAFLTKVSGLPAGAVPPAPRGTDVASAVFSWAYDLGIAAGPVTGKFVLNGASLIMTRGSDNPGPVRLTHPG